MPQKSAEKTRARREEIVDACEQLYQAASFETVSIKDISAKTSMSRPSIYNYFQTREEIFLALLSREYQRWNESLEKLIEQSPYPSRQTLAKAIAATLEEREQLLKLIAMNLYTIEQNVRLEQLTEFKREYKKTLQAWNSLLQVNYPQLDEQWREQTMMLVFPFLFGIYPFTSQSEKQAEAMKAAGLEKPGQSIAALSEHFLISILPPMFSTQAPSQS